MSLQNRLGGVFSIPKFWSTDQLYLVLAQSKQMQGAFWRLTFKLIPLTSSLAAVVANQLKLFKTAGSWALWCVL